MVFQKRTRWSSNYLPGAFASVLVYKHGNLAPPESPHKEKYKISVKVCRRRDAVYAALCCWLNACGCAYEAHVDN